MNHKAFLKRGQVALEIPGAQDPILLRFGPKAIRLAESEDGEDRPFLEYVQSFGAEGVKIGDLLVGMFLYASLEEHPDMTEEAAEILIADAGIGETLEALTQCVTLAFPGVPADGSSGQEDAPGEA